MASAQATTNEAGYLTMMSHKIGTGGHGDTSEIYNKTYEKVLSMVGYSKNINTGNRDSEGRIIYRSERLKKIRFDKLSQIHDFNPVAYDSIRNIIGLKDADIKCFDLIATHEKGLKKGLKYKVGLSIVCGKFEARVVRGSCALFQENIRVGNFKK
tara:strand:+ start:194 stop:658 length:465 start_codon:yes stop_codon:yes gene_type:complete